MSWKPAVKVFGENSFCMNGLTFETEAEALANAEELAGRWMAVEDFKAVEVDTAGNPVNYKWVAGKAEKIE